MYVSFSYHFHVLLMPFLYVLPFLFDILCLSMFLIVYIITQTFFSLQEDKKTLKCIHLHNDYRYPILFILLSVHIRWRNWMCSEKRRTRHIFFFKSHMWIASRISSLCVSNRASYQPIDVYMHFKTARLLFMLQTSQVLLHVSLSLSLSHSFLTFTFNF